MATPSEQLEAMRLLRENWDGYGAAALQSQVIGMVQTEVTACGVPLLGRPANLHPPSAQPGRPSSGTRRIIVGYATQTYASRPRKYS